MTLLGVLFDLFVVVGVLCLVAAVTIVGPQKLRTVRQTYRQRLRELYPDMTILVIILVLNALVRDATQELSWLVGWNITPLIRQIEGEFIVFVQSFAAPPLTWYFSRVYVYGYVFLLVFPFIAYAALENRPELRQLLVAYTLNYGIGLICYIVFIAYGPRNSLGGAVDSLLYIAYPQYQLLTTEVNVNTNVFPSLHTSLSVTAAIFAVRTRDVYPLWTPIAVVLAVSVLISTMYLGIHWLLDVLAGIVLGSGAVYLARRYTEDS